MPLKAQHLPTYQPLPSFLRQLREEASLTQRALGSRLDKAQSWVYNCETGNRRVDITEFARWADACEVEPKTAFAKLLKAMNEQQTDTTSNN